MKKKYFIKIITFLSAFAVVLLCIFFQNYKQKSENTQIENVNMMQILNNITASIEEIRASFEKGTDLNTLSNESKKIYANSHNIKNMLFLTNEDFSNTVSWFSELNEYSKGDMSDDNKNTEYFNRLKEVHQIFIDTCQEYPKTKNTRKIELYFTPQHDSEYYGNLLSKLENQYLFLETQIKYDIKEVTNLAKNTLNSPITPKQFKGNYQLPSPLTYFTANSYANIFREGNILCRMSIADNFLNKNNLYTSLTSHSQKHLQNYANYAQQLTEVYSYTDTSLVYYVFCPYFTENNQTVINYDEPIRMGLSLNDGSLKAFDSTQYLKNHTKKQINKFNFNFSDISLPKEFDNVQILSQKHIIKNNEYFAEYKIKSNGDIYYYLYSDNTEKFQVYNEREYFRYMEII